MTYPGSTFKESAIRAAKQSLGLLALFCLPALANALGVGSLHLNSILNQKLDAKIELLSVTDEEAAGLSVSLAPDTVYQRMGIERNALIEQLKFRVEQDEKGVYFIQVSTPNPVVEPFLNFLIEVNWQSGRLLREFTILLDPPVLTEEAPQPVQTPQAELPPTFTVTTPEPSAKEEKIELAPVVKSKVEEEISAIVDGKDEQPETTSAASTVLQDNSKLESQASSLNYDKVKKNEILWNIADNMRPADVSVEQMMLALLRENPKAFFGDNISMLKEGAVLRIKDTSTLYDVPVEAAIAEVAKQHQDWLAYRRERQAKQTVLAESSKITPQGKDATQAKVDELMAATESESRLKLVSPLEEQPNDKIAQTNAVLEAAEEKLGQLNIELALANESIEAGKRENEDLLHRLSSLEEQMSAMQSLIQLKDAELQKLKSGTKSALPVEMPSMTLEMPGDETPDQPVVHKEGTHDTMHDENYSLWNDPLTIGTGIGSLILILTLLLVLKRQRSKLEKMDEEETEELEEKSLDELFPEENTTEKTVIRFNDTVEERTPSEFGIEPLTEINFGETEQADEAISALDPVAEVDVYLTYEKYDKAEELLLQAIDKQPERQELKLKLLEVYGLARNVENFNQQAEELYAAVGGDESHQLWQHARLLAEDVDTDSPLFHKKEVATESAETETSEPLVEMTLQPIEPVQPVESRDEETGVEITQFKEEWIPDTVTEISPDEQPLLTGVDSELFVESEKDETPTSSQEVLIEESSALAEEEIELEQQTEIAPAAVTSAVVSDEELEKAMNSFTEESLLEEDDVALEKDITVSNVFDDDESFEETKKLFETKPFVDSSLFLLSDEVGTKLDLARAYIEMGDNDGATDLLKEVLDEGNEKQKAEASALLNSFSAVPY